MEHDLLPTSSNITIRLWTTNQNKPAPKPDFQVTFINAWPAETALQLSQDGSRMGVLFNRPDNTSHFVLYDAKADKQILEYVGNGLGRHLVVSNDKEERFYAFHLGGSIVVFDSQERKTRWQQNVQFSDTALDLTEDATLLVYGFISLEVALWNGKQYISIYSTKLPNYYVFNIVAKSNKIVVAWAAYDNLQTIVQTYERGTDGTVKLVFTAPYGKSVALQDVPAGLSITDDANWFVVGTWGNQTQYNPQVRLFSTSGDETAVATLSTPGSVFAVDVANDVHDPKMIHVVAACKMTHANTMGNGGGLYYLTYENK